MTNMAIFIANVDNLRKTEMIKVPTSLEHVISNQRANMSKHPDLKVESILSPMHVAFKT